MVKAMCWGQHNDRKRAKDLMLAIGLSETIDQLVTANSVHWYGHVLRKENSYAL